MLGPDHRFDLVHLVGSIALTDCEQVFSRVSAELGPYIDKIPDGETGERARWIYFQRTMLEQHPDMELDPDAAPLKLHQWDGTLLRETPLLRFKPDADTSSINFDTGYDKAASYSYGVFKRLRDEGVVPDHVRFQVCLPTPMASGYMYVSPAARDEYCTVYMRSLQGALRNIMDSIDHGDLALQFDVCQEVLIFEDYFPERPADYKERIFAELAQLGDAVAADIPMGYHLCYGTPYDEHLVMPKDMTVLVEMMRGILGATQHDVDFLHVPVPKDRSDDAYFEPLNTLKLAPDTRLFLGLIHYDDAAGDQQRIETAKHFVERFGIASECGWGRTDPKRVPGLLASHRAAAESLL